MAKKQTTTQANTEKEVFGTPRYIIRNPSNYVSPPGKIFEQASQTVPDQSMTVNEMVQRYNSGLPMRGQKVPIFNGEDPLPDISNMDLADAQMVTEAIADQLADIKARIDQAKTSAQAKAEIERVESLVQKRLLEIQKEQKNENKNTQE